MFSFIFFAFYPLPCAYYPEFVFGPPEEFVSVFFFLLALTGYVRKGAWRHDQFEFWLVISLIVGCHPGWLTGVRIGPASQDRLTRFVPPHAHETRVLQGVAGEGVAVDADGNVYAAEGPGSRPTAGGGITKYVAAGN